MQQSQIICLTKGCQYSKIIKPGKLLMHTQNKHQIINIQKMKDKLSVLYPNIWNPEDEYTLLIDEFKEKVGDLLMKYIKDLIQRETKNYELIQLIQKISNDEFLDQDLKSNQFNVLVDCYNENYDLKIDLNSKEQFWRIHEILDSLFQQIQKIILEGPQKDQKCQNQFETPTPDCDQNLSEQLSNKETQIYIDQRQVQQSQNQLPQLQQISQVQQIAQIAQIQQIQQDSYEFQPIQVECQVYLKLSKNNTQIQNISKENIEQIALVKLDMNEFHQMTFLLQKQVIKIGVIDYSKIEDVSSDNFIGKCLITITDDPLKQYIMNGTNKEQVPFDVKIQSILNLEWDPNKNSISFLCSKKKKKITYTFERTDFSKFEIVVWLGQGAQTQVQKMICS